MCGVTIFVSAAFIHKKSLKEGERKFAVRIVVARKGVLENTFFKKKSKFVLFYSISGGHEEPSIKKKI